MKSPRSVLAVALLATVLLSGCATKERSARPTGASQATACPSTDPASYATQLRQQKARALASIPGAEPATASTDKNYVYTSQPVDITGPGSYTFRFGPVADDYNYPVSPASFGMGPAGRVPFSLKPSKDDAAHVVKETDGSRYLETTLEVSGDVRPCPGLVLFLY